MKLLTIAALALCLTSSVALAAVDTKAPALRQVAPPQATSVQKHLQVAWGTSRNLPPSVAPKNGKTWWFPAP